MLALALLAATTIGVTDSDYGPILADGTGLAVYRFDKETSRRPRCYGACAKAWPPVYTTDAPVAGTGAKPGLLGTVRRRDGRLQVTYRNRPLYFYEFDTPGNVLCHDVDEFGGLWQVVRRSGRPVD